MTGEHQKVTSLQLTEEQRAAILAAVAEGNSGDEVELDAWEVLEIAELLHGDLNRLKEDLAEAFGGVVYDCMIVIPDHLQWRLTQVERHVSEISDLARAAL